MPKFVVFLKNSTLLALLCLFFTCPLNAFANTLPPDKEMFLCRFLRSKVHADCGGLVGDTLVKTPDGYEKIRDLRPGQQILSFDIRSGQACIKTITSIKPVLTKKTRCLQLTDAERTLLRTGTKQCFYTLSPTAILLGLADPYAWSNAAILEVFSLSTNNKVISIKSTQQETELTILYQLEVAEAHNFFVTQNDILVHNNSAAFSAASAITNGLIKMGKAMLVVIVGKKVGEEAVKAFEKMQKKSNQPETPKEETKKPATPATPVVAVTSPSEGPTPPPNKPPKKDEDKKSKSKKDGPNCVGKCDNEGCQETKDALRGQTLEAQKRADLAAEQLKDTCKSKSRLSWDGSVTPETVLSVASVSLNVWQLMSSDRQNEELNKIRPLLQDSEKARRTQEDELVVLTRKAAVLEKKLANAEKDKALMRESIAALEEEGRLLRANGRAC